MNQKIIQILANIIMGGEIEWEQPDTQERMEAEARNHLDDAEFGILSVFWDQYVEAALNYIKQTIEAEDNTKYVEVLKQSNGDKHVI